MKRVVTLVAAVLLVVASAPMAQEGHGHHAKPSGKPVTLTVMDHDGVKAIAISSTTAETAAAVYTCSMHPDVKQDAPGKCTKCGMNLEKVKN
jgi:hypothetical protein